MPIIDLRSDTITHPTPAMRAAMAHAAVGDDVFGDDPTVNRLQEMAAARLGKEAALFVASGTMGNLAALLSHCARGDEVIMGHLAHTFLNEQGGAAAVGGIHTRTVPNRPDGALDLHEVAAAIRGDDDHYPITRLICLENTQNRCGGAVLDAAYTQAVGRPGAPAGLRLHIDGARIFNAAVALGVDVRELVAPADSVSFCLSKGLAAPVAGRGGLHAFIARRRNRKVLGGGMRQAGILAAAGIVALEEMVDRLAEDHAHARTLAQGLVQIPGLVVDLAGVQTNIVYFDVQRPDLTPAQLADALEAAGVRLLPAGGRSLRAVTHYQVSRADVERAVDIIAGVMRG
ncbi:MAG: low-specificity L-threonine aldolase [Anaerolineae bacterium]|nr:MAG: low-specificity L-threonine aldolase [Anaerolineae bacterium]